MNLIPRHDRLLVRIQEAKEVDLPQSKLKLILPEQKDTYPMPRKGEIIAVGDGENCARMGFKEGDIVLFSKYVGQPMKISPRLHSALEEDFEEGQVYLFLNTKDIYGRENA